MRRPIRPRRRPLGVRSRPRTPPQARGSTLRRPRTSRRTACGFQHVAGRIHTTRTRPPARGRTAPRADRTRQRRLGARPAQRVRGHQRLRRRGPRQRRGRSRRRQDRRQHRHLHRRRRRRGRTRAGDHRRPALARPASRLRDPRHGPRRVDPSDRAVPTPHGPSRDHAAASRRPPDRRSSSSTASGSARC